MVGRISCQIDCGGPAEFMVLANFLSNARAQIGKSKWKRLTFRGWRLAAKVVILMVVLKQKQQWRLNV